jgi:chorismate mutase / prephenate dehydratase
MPEPVHLPHPDLLALRAQIDGIDRDLLALLNRRATLAQHVGEVKKIEGSVAFRPEREAQVIDGLKAANPGPLKADSVAPIWREIMSACRALETPTRVAYLGPAGTFSELAALGFFGSSIVRVACANFDEVLHVTTSGAADFGVLPVENSTEGVVTRSLDLFLTTPLAIVGETSLICRQNLMRRDNSLTGITAVCAHPQALAQCNGWNAGPCPATPKGRGWRPWTLRWQASRANGQRVNTGCTSSLRRSRTTHTTAPASRSWRTPSGIRARKHRGTIAPAWSSPSPTGRARCTTCWCR